jgi:hypothetical protein
MRLFWLLSNNISRIEADRDRRALRIALCSNSGEASAGLLQELNNTVGEVVQVSVQARLEERLDREGLDELRRLSQMGL